MEVIELNYHRIDIGSEFGPVLHSSEHMDKMNELARNVGKNALILVDFQNVEASTIKFIGSMLRSLNEVNVATHYQGPLLVTENVHLDIAPSIQASFTNRTPGVLVHNNQELSLISNRPRLNKVFEYAHDLTKTNGLFTSSELAKSLKINVTSTNAQLSVLGNTGSIIKTADPESPRGKRYLYRTPVDTTL